MFVGSKIAHKVHFVVNLCRLRPAESQTTLHKGYADRRVLFLAKFYAQLQSVKKFGRNLIFVVAALLFGLRGLFFLFVLEDSVFDIIVEVRVVFGF